MGAPEALAHCSQGLMLTATGCGLVTQRVAISWFREPCSLPPPHKHLCCSRGQQLLKPVLCVRKVPGGGVTSPTGVFSVKGPQLWWQQNNQFHSSALFAHATYSVLSLTQTHVMFSVWRRKFRGSSLPPSEAPNSTLSYPADKSAYQLKQRLFLQCSVQRCYLPGHETYSRSSQQVTGDQHRAGLEDDV